MPFADVGDLQVYYEIHGSGPRVLNISGSGNDLRISRPQLDPLNKHFEVLHYDQRCLGQTTGGTDTPTMADYAADAVELMAVLGWDRCHVVGTSFGGMVALQVVTRFPEAVNRLVLRCTSPGGAHPSYPLHELDSLPAVERAEATLGLMDSRYDPESEEGIPGIPLVVQAIRQRASSPPNLEAAAGSARQLGARRGHDVESLLSSIKAQTLICAGRYDLLAPPANSELLAAQIPNATLEMFDGGHAFMFQDRAASVSVADFLGQPDA